MTAQKRGLGRGLEALLADVSTKEDQQLVSTTKLIKAIQTENANLIEEAQALKLLLDDFEALVRNLNVDN
jgi:ParB-like chromosome segregation protein Spo0J